MRPMLLNLISEESRVDVGVERQECLTEARGEASLGFFDSLFGTGDLGGVA